MIKKKTKVIARCLNGILDALSNDWALNSGIDWIVHNYAGAVSLDLIVPRKIKSWSVFHLARALKSMRLLRKDENTKCCLEGLWRPSLTRGGVWGSTMSQTWGLGTSIASKFAASRWPVEKCEYIPMHNWTDGFTDAILSFREPWFLRRKNLFGTHLQLFHKWL